MVRSIYLLSVPMREISYPDTNLCIAIGDSGYYWRSVDRCRTWNRGYIPSRIRAIECLDFLLICMIQYRVALLPHLNYFLHLMVANPGISPV